MVQNSTPLNVLRAQVHLSNLARGATNPRSDHSSFTARGMPGVACPCIFCTLAHVHHPRDQISSAHLFLKIACVSEVTHNIVELVCSRLLCQAHLPSPYCSSSKPLSPPLLTLVSQSERNNGLDCGGGFQNCVEAKALTATFHVLKCSVFVCEVKPPDSISGHKAIWTAPLCENGANMLPS
ncbi:hypothetical protein BaRGS_00017717 [Batillaria attramentaria]|uniref:Uncharacterized protein n=1 Tax=Batillaria attramentaria TaxID=370345 RepID=A0ABD0KUS9_9CAEN